MTSGRVSGTDGYAEEAETLVGRYESIDFADLHGWILHLIPKTPGRVLDIGSGTGRDAAAFADMGHDVVAIEPTDAFRRRAKDLHPSPRIEWLDGSLPDLACLDGRGGSFDVIMLTAVWMHLDQEQRVRAMPRIASLLRGGGVLILILRHGPVPPGRRMFEVSGDDTARLAKASGLDLELRCENEDGFFKRKDVSWTRLAFRKVRKPA